MLKLNAEKREVFGKRLKALRGEGKMPIIVYGAKENPTPFFVDTKEFKKVLAAGGESSIITLHTDAGEKDTLINAIDFHPLTDEPIHADFLVVEKNKPIKVHVPFEFIGEAPAEKNFGGAIIKVMHEIEIESLPKDLPQHIVVDMAALDALDSKITVADLKLPAGVTTEVEPEEVVVSVTVAGEEVAEEAAAPDLASIEVEKKGKAEEGSTEGETAK